MRESAIERYLVQQVAKVGGKAYKWISPGNRGVPDRIIFFPHTVLAFVELKAPGGRLRPGQKIQRERLRKLGIQVFVMDSKKKVDELIRTFNAIHS